ncbi:MAG: hypothetical protein AB1445_05615 [Bacillota bacterium]
MAATVEESAAATGDMAGRSNQVRQSMNTIAAVGEETAASPEEVAASSEELSAGIEEVAASSRALAEVATAMHRLIQEFKRRHQSPAATEMTLRAELSQARAR